VLPSLFVAPERVYSGKLTAVYFGFWPEVAGCISHGNEPPSASTCATAASRDRLIRVGSLASRARKNGNLTGGFFMKYLLLILAATAFVSTASATSRAADCCTGGACCMFQLSCCGE